MVLSRLLQLLKVILEPYTRLCVVSGLTSSMPLSLWWEPMNSWVTWAPAALNRDRSWPSRFIAWCATYYTTEVQSCWCHVCTACQSPSYYCPALHLVPVTVSTLRTVNNHSQQPLPHHSLLSMHAMPHLPANPPSKPGLSAASHLPSPHPHITHSPSEPHSLLRQPVVTILSQTQVVIMCCTFAQGVPGVTSTHHPASAAHWRGEHSHSLTLRAAEGKDALS